jgi:methyl-accepting chemotaxis protein
MIQEIAFQTNLLALNASVEAARAGSAGRGFAVVANEVRALAQRSAAASKDIKELITSSDGQVQEGVSLVGEAGGALEEIVTSVKKVADLVSEIAGASREQTAGLDQVSSAVNNMDEMTQKNAALVEETTSAIMSAVTQVDDLQTAVGFFKTKRSSVPAEAEPSQEMTAVA